MYKLNIHLIPKTAYGQNMRSKLKASEWAQISSFVRSIRFCAGCKKETDFEDLEAHEVWIFEKHKQKLRRIVPLCKKCHRAVHIGRAYHGDALDEAYKQFKKARGWSYARVEYECNSAWDKWTKKSKKKYKLTTTLEEAWAIAKKDQAELLKWKEKKNKKK